jgi:acetoacetate decarboxylase
MEPDAAKAYLMPLVMGPVFDLGDAPGAVYEVTRGLAASFRTDRDAVRPLVPSIFEIPDEATVTVGFGDHSGFDVMAGRGYRVAYVGVSASFRGEEESADGLYIVVMWETDALPILLGRELIGIPKIGAEITALGDEIGEGCEAIASTWGHEVLRLEVAGLREQGRIVRRTATKRVNATPWLGYKHIPSLDGPPDASYPMVVWNEVRLDRLFLGTEATVGFGDATASEIGQLSRVGDALRGVPLGELAFASRSLGSAVLRIDRSHRLR